MKTHFKACLLAATALSITSINTAIADNQSSHNHHGHENHASVSPLNVMEDHTHAKGQWMVSYQFQHMKMQGNIQGRDSISNNDFVTTISNPNAPPATLRVVPTEMDMNMHMLGTMYGLTDKITLMAMAMYMDNSMEHITYAGMSGTTVLGRFKTETKGWGDTSLSGIYNLYETQKTRINISLGVSAPTGSIKEEYTVLTPMNMTPRLRLPYAMQLGSGTWDGLLGATYSGQSDKWSWGAQYKATIRLEDENSQSYRLGDRHIVNTWAGRQLSPSIAVLGKISLEKTGKIKGRDANITAPVQTANPNNYGGKFINAGIGLQYRPKYTPIRGISIDTELTLPIYQNVNGVQMERDWGLGFRISKSF